MAKENGFSSKRDYLLPSGCKDLIEVLKLDAKKMDTFGPVTVKSFPHRKAKVSKPPRTVFLDKVVVVKDLARALGIKLYTLVAVLREMKIFTSVNQKVSFHTAAKVARRFRCSAERKSW
jgi:hypothetical protein